MVYLRWTGVIVFSLITIYLFIWIGGGLGNLFSVVTFPREYIIAILAMVGIVVVGIGTLMIFNIVALGSDESTIAFAMWLVMSTGYAMEIDPIMTFGFCPWQWRTWWSLVPAGFGFIVVSWFIEEMLNYQKIYKRDGNIWSVDKN